MRVVRNNGGDVERSVEERLALASAGGAERIPADRLFRPFYLMSDVLIQSDLALSVGGTFAARLWSGPATNSTLLLEHDPAAAGSARAVNGENGASFAAHGETTEVWLQVLSPGTGEISYSLTGKGNAAGIDFTDKLPITAYRDKLYVQRMTEDDYATGIGTGDAVNPGINWQQFDINAIMQEVADFYGDQFGIDLIWASTPLSKPDPMPHTYTHDNTSVADLYRHTGAIVYPANDLHPNGETISDGFVWLHYDHKLFADDRRLCRLTYLRGNKASKLIKENRDDEALKEYVKVALPKRFGERRPDGTYWIDTGGHAQINPSGDIDVQGAHIDIVSISEEHYRDCKAHYPPDTFSDRIAYCIAHEIFHLIGGTDKATAGLLGGPFRPLRDIEVSDEERREVNLSDKMSVKP